MSARTNRFEIGPEASAFASGSGSVTPRDTPSTMTSTLAGAVTTPTVDEIRSSVSAIV